MVERSTWTYIVSGFVVILLQVMWLDTLKFRDCRGRVSVTIGVYTRERRDRTSTQLAKSVGHKSSRLVCNRKEFQGILMAEQWTRWSRDSDIRPCKAARSIDTAWVRLSFWLLFLALEFHDILYTCFKYPWIKDPHMLI